MGIGTLDGPNDPFCGHLWVGEPMDMVGFEAFLHLLIMWSFWSSYGIVTLLLCSWNPWIWVES